MMGRSVWYCHSCGYGPLNPATDSACASCNHRWCSYCREEKIQTYDIRRQTTVTPQEYSISRPSSPSATVTGAYRRTPVTSLSPKSSTSLLGREEESNAGGSNLSQVKSHWKEDRPPERALSSLETEDHREKGALLRTLEPPDTTSQASDDVWQKMKLHGKWLNTFINTGKLRDILQIYSSLEVATELEIRQDYLRCLESLEQRFGRLSKETRNEPLEMGSVWLDINMAAIESILFDSMDSYNTELYQNTVARSKTLPAAVELKYWKHDFTSFFATYRPWGELEKLLVQLVWRRLQILWCEELGRNLYPEIIALDITKVQLQQPKKLSVWDKLKYSIENYTGKPWDWWPLRPPLAEETVRVSITRMIQGRPTMRHKDISKSLAKILAILFKYKNIMSLSYSSALDISTSNPVSMVDTNIAESSTIPHRQESDSRTPNQRLSGERNSKQIQDHGPFATSNDVGLPNNFTHVLICGFWRSRFQARTIQTSRIEYPNQVFDDEAFYLALRNQYNSIFGFLGLLKPVTFFYCEFARFSKKKSHHLKFSCHEVPCSQSHHIEDGGCPPCSGNYDWEKPVRGPILSRDDWADFHSPIEGRGKTYVIRRIPKCKAEFQLDKDPIESDAEDMWGLEIVTQPCFWKVMAWLFALGAVSVVFWVTWLSSHTTDMQGATTILVITLTSAAVVIQLSRYFEQNLCNGQCTIHI